MPFWCLVVSNSQQAIYQGSVFFYLVYASFFTILMLICFIVSPIFLQTAEAMAANQEATFPPLPKANKRADYYPLWRHVKKIARIPGGGSWEWRCTLCNGLYKGSYPRVRAHFLHETGKGVDSCMKTSDPGERRKFEDEQQEADRVKRRHDELNNASCQA